MPAPGQVMDEIRAVARTSTDELLADARRRLRRVCPAEALQAISAGAALIDIRADSQVARDGIVAGSPVIPGTCWNGGWIPRASTAVPVRRSSVITSS
jgi:hypothetical protein